MKQLIIIFSLICSVILSIKAEERADSTMMRWMRAEGMIEYEADSISIYTHAKDKLLAMHEDFRNAKKSIDIEYFIFADDSTAHATLNELQAAAKRGVKVRLIVDGYKDKANKYGYDSPRKDSLSKIGVETRIFDPWRFPHLSHMPRDHRKVVVIDGKVGYTGGFNVADYYIKGNPETYGAWRDTHIRITGNAVKGLSWLFEKSWKVIETGRYKGEIEHLLPDSIRRPNTSNPQGKGEIWMSSTKAKVMFFERSRENKKKKTETRRTLVEAFNSAKDTIRFVTPYFVPTHTLRVAIENALKRGVVVQLLISKISDATIFNATNMNAAKHFMKMGAEIYLYKGAFHHSKIIMIDGQFSMVGSANMNSRSLKWDYEESCFIFDKKITEDLTRIFEEDKKQCDIMTKELYKDIPFSKRTIGWLSRTFLTLFM